MSKLTSRGSNALRSCGATENLIVLLELMTKEKDSMPQDNIDLIMGQDYVILQLERWVDENKKIISHWNTDEESLKKH